MDDLFTQFLGDGTGPRIGQFAITTLVVLLLLLAVYWLGRRIWSGYTGGIQRSRVPRLAIVDALAVDGRRRLLLVRRDAVEHLILVGGSTDLVVEPNILRARQRMAPAMLGGPAALSGLSPYQGGPGADASAPGAGMLAPGSDQRLARHDEGNEGAPMPFPFSPIGPEPAADRPSDAGVHADGAAPDPEFGPMPAWLGRPGLPDESESSTAQPLTEPSAHARRTPAAPSTPFADAPPMRPLNGSGNGNGGYHPTGADPGPPAANTPGARVSELEAEMNRLLGQLSADHRSH